MEKFTVEGVVDELVKRFEGMEDKVLSFKNSDDFALWCHSMLSGGIAMNVRNTYDLWDADSDMHKHFIGIGIMHPDDMSHHILKLVYDKIKENRT